VRDIRHQLDVEDVHTRVTDGLSKEELIPLSAMQ
jgi:hypothetical protein